MTAVDVNAVSSFPSTPQINLAFEPDEHMFVNEHASEIVDFSFDGINIHGRLRPGEPTEGLVLPVKYKKIWFKGSGAASSIVTRVTSYNK